MGVAMMLLLNVLARLIAEELLAFGRVLAKWIIIKSTEWLPEEEQNPRREELLAHLNEIDSVLLRLAHALSFALSVRGMAADLRGETTAQLPSRRVSMASLKKLEKTLAYRTVIRLAAFLRDISSNLPIHGLKFLRGTRERRSSLNQIAKAAASIVAIVSVLIGIPAGPIFIESHHNPATDPHVKIEARGPNRTTGSSPLAGQLAASSTSPNSGGVALVPDRAEAFTRAAPRVNSGVPLDTSINSVIGAASSFTNSQAILGRMASGGIALPLSPDIPSFAANLSGVASSLSSGSPLLTGSVSLLAGQTSLNAAPYLNNGVPAVASSPVVNLSALVGGDPRALAEAYLGTGIRPWGLASDALGTMSPQFAGAIPAVHNTGSLGTSTAIINVTDMAGGSHFLTRALTQLDEVTAIQQVSLTSNYFILQEGRYLTPSASDSGYLTPAAIANGISPGALTLDQTIPVSHGASVGEPTFLVGRADALRPLTAGLSAVISQGSLSSGMSPCARVGYSEALGRIVPSCDPAVTLPQTIITTSPPTIGGFACTGL